MFNKLYKKSKFEKEFDKFNKSNDDHFDKVQRKYEVDKIMMDRDFSKKRLKFENINHIS